MPIGFLPDKTFTIIFGRGDLTVRPVILNDISDTHNVLLIEVASKSVEIGDEGSRNDIDYYPVTAICFEKPESVDVLIKNLEIIRKELSVCDLSKCRINLTEFPDELAEKWIEEGRKAIDETK